MTNRVESSASKVDDLTPEQRRQLLEQLLREKEKRNAEQRLEKGRAHELFMARPLPWAHDLAWLPLSQPQ